jgi:hypothetical protein
VPLPTIHLKLLQCLLDWPAHASTWFI